MYLVLLAFASSPFSLLAAYKFLFFLHFIYASSQHINVIGINQKLMCTILFQAILYYLNPHNGVL